MPYQARPCRTCGQTLPEQRRGRPAATHPGECRRLWHNKRSWAARIERFRAAHRPPQSDRSDDLGWVQQWDGDGLLEDHGLAPIPPSPVLNLGDDALRAAVNHWEEQTRLLREVRDLLVAGGYRGGLLPEEHAELVRRKAEREARPRRLIDILLQS